jgi:hypothetical protein
LSSELLLYQCPRSKRDWDKLIPGAVNIRVEHETKWVR